MTERPATERYQWIWLLLLCVYGFLHSAAYALNNPVFESPDEPGHLTYVNAMALGKGMPNQYDSKQFLAEGHQNPLYYLLAGTVLRVSGGPILASLPPSGLDSPAPIFNHRPSPFHSARDRLRFYLLRLIGSIIVALTVFATGRASRTVLPIGHVWLVAPMLVAMLPQFAFIGGSISNDGLVALMGACISWAAARCCLNPERARAWLWLGVWIGMAFLAKKNALAFVPASLILVVAFMLYRQAGVRRLAQNTLLTGVAALILFLPVLIHNWRLYGELLGTNMEMQTMPFLAYTQALTSHHFRVIFPDVVPRSFVGQLGWMVVEVRQQYVWPVVHAIEATAVLGIFAMVDRAKAAITAFCASAVVANLIGLVYYNMMFPQAQGRLLFPTVAPLMLLCCIGFYMLSRRVSLPYKSLGLLPIFICMLWFDLLCYWTNQDFYAWYGQKLGF